MSKKNKKSKVKLYIVIGVSLLLNGDTAQPPVHAGDSPSYRVCIGFGGGAKP